MLSRPSAVRNIEARKVVYSDDQVSKQKEIPNAAFLRLTLYVAKFTLPISKWVTFFQCVSATSGNGLPGILHWDDSIC